MKYYIKRRINPLLECDYYVSCSKLSDAEAQRHRKPMQGTNILLPYDTLKDYQDAIKDLRNKGFDVL